MSFASDILRQAIERNSKAHAAHLEKVAEQCEEMTDVVRYPHRRRVDQIKDAVEQIQSNPERSGDP